jgi:galactokinase
MTGAGFGGCTVSLVKKDNIERFIKRVGTVYKEKTGLEAAFYISEAGEGGREVV